MVKIIEDFEISSLGSEYPNQSDISLSTTYAYNGSKSLNLSRKGNPTGRFEPTELSGGEDIDYLEFYWFETVDQTGGSLLVKDSNDNRVAGFASDNPEWNVRDGSNWNFVYNPGDYRDWTRVKMTFDYQNNEVTYDVEDLSDGDTFSGTFPMENNASDVESIVFRAYSYGTFGSDVTNMWFDNITVDGLTTSTAASTSFNSFSNITDSGADFEAQVDSQTNATDVNLGFDVFDSSGNQVKSVTSETNVDLSAKSLPYVFSDSVTSLSANSDYDVMSFVRINTSGNKFSSLQQPFTTKFTQMVYPVQYSNLAAWYPFENADGSDVTAGDPSSGDSTDYSFTVNGPTHKSSSGVKDINTGADSGVFTFNGTGDTLDNTSTSIVSGSNARTITAWIKTTSGQSQVIVSSGESSTGSKFTFRQDSSGDVLRGEIQGDKFLGSTSISDGKWHHVVIRYDGSGSLSGCDIFLDGQLEATNSSSSSINTTDKQFYVGKFLPNTPASGFWDGKIDDVRIYNTNLTQSEIQSIYQNTKNTVATNVNLSFNSVSNITDSGADFEAQVDSQTAADNADLGFEVFDSSGSLINTITTNTGVDLTSKSLPYVFSDSTSSLSANTTYKVRSFVDHESSTSTSSKTQFSTAISSISLDYKGSYKGFKTAGTGNKIRSIDIDINLQTNSTAFSNFKSQIENKILESIENGSADDLETGVVLDTGTVLHSDSLIKSVDDRSIDAKFAVQESETSTSDNITNFQIQDQNGNIYWQSDQSIDGGQDVIITVKFLSK